ncbi:MAG: hypothetical protein JRH15_13510 [Deltaproteobacteria bacterium]|nr:hypothetical protein [Deltaproteobacteria bacterium]
MFISSAPEEETAAADETRKGLLPWAMAVGLVPCPAVVMVMLFCLSMDATILGLLMASCISLGMALTISLVITAVGMGKTMVLTTVSSRYGNKVESVIRILSGTAIAVFGTIFLVTAIHTVSY